MLVALAVLAVVACKEKKDTNRPVLSIQSENEEADTTAYGKCFGAAMNSLMLVTDNGDTIAEMLETEKDAPLVCLHEVIYDQRGRPLHNSIQLIRGERFVFRI